jgi:hypothetical protein
LLIVLLAHVFSAEICSSCRIRQGGSLMYTGVAGAAKENSWWLISISEYAASRGTTGNKLLAAATAIMGTLQIAGAVLLNATNVVQTSYMAALIAAAAGAVLLGQAETNVPWDSEDTHGDDVGESANSTGDVINGCSIGWTGSDESPEQVLLCHFCGVKRKWWDWLQCFVKVSCLRGCFTQRADSYYSNPRRACGRCEENCTLLRRCFGACVCGCCGPSWQVPQPYRSTVNASALLANADANSERSIPAFMDPNVLEAIIQLQRVLRRISTEVALLPKTSASLPANATPDAMHAPPAVGDDEAAADARALVEGNNLRHFSERADLIRMHAILRVQVSVLNTLVRNAAAAGNLTSETQLQSTLTDLDTILSSLASYESVLRGPVQPVAATSHSVAVPTALTPEELLKSIASTIAQLSAVANWPVAALKGHLNRDWWQGIAKDFRDETSQPTDTLLESKPSKALTDALEACGGNVSQLPEALKTEALRLWYGCESQTKSTRELRDAALKILKKNDGEFAQLAEKDRAMVLLYMDQRSANTRGELTDAIAAEIQHYHEYVKQDNLNHYVRFGTQHDQAACCLCIPVTVELPPTLPKELQYHTPQYCNTTGTDCCKITVPPKDEQHKQRSECHLCKCLRIDIDDCCGVDRSKATAIVRPEPSKFGCIRALYAKFHMFGAMLFIFATAIPEIILDRGNGSGKILGIIGIAFFGAFVVLQICAGSAPEFVCHPSLCLCPQKPAYRLLASDRSWGPRHAIKYFLNHDFGRTCMGRIMVMVELIAFASVSLSNAVPNTVSK